MHRLIEPFEQQLWLGAAVLPRDGAGGVCGGVRAHAVGPGVRTVSAAGVGDRGIVETATAPLAFTRDQRYTSVASACRSGG